MSDTPAIRTYKARTVNVYHDDVASVEDVMQLILRLPYLQAVELAAAIEADVDKMVDGAFASFVAKGDQP